MTQIINVIVIWLHSLAATLFVGYFIVLALIVVPPLAEAENGKALSGVSRVSRRWMYASLLVFILSGLYLMFADAEYLGFAQIGNLWSAAMLIKHILVLGMLAAGFWFNAIWRVGPKMDTPHETGEAIARFRRYINLMAWMGSGVLLLTSLAQA